MSLPEVSIEEQLQYIANQILDQLRILYQQFTENNANHTQVYSKIDGIKSSVEDLKYKLGEYIFRVAEGINNKELYLDILSDFEKISQNISAASYRFGVLNNVIKVYDNVLQNLSITITEKLIAALMNTIEAIRLLSVSSKKASEKARNVIKIEEEVDDLYRNFEVKLFEREQSGIAYILLTKDVADRLEDCADLLRNVANSILYIS